MHVLFDVALVWIHTLGNHDARFESYLSSHVPQFRGVDGFRLKDHIPLWRPCWSFWINDDTVIKHRHKGGAYAGYNNVKAALGCHVVTGHTHILAVQPITGYQQTFYGIQTGTLANPKGNQFVDYTEDNPVDWRSGFVILTYLVIVGSSNAVNLTDGLDGLSIMPVVMVGSALGVFAYVTGSSVYSKYLIFPYIPGSGELLIFCAAMAGAGLAFLTS